MQQRVPDFTGKTCVITGAASGLGRETAVLMAQAGANVVVLDLDATGLGETGAIEPFTAAWLPNFCFLGAGLILLYRVRT